MSAQSFTDPDVAQFRGEVKEWLRATIPAEWSERFFTGISEEQHRQIRGEWDRLVAGAGYAGLLWPKPWGPGLGPIEEFVFFEEAAALHAPDMINYIGYDLAGPAIIYCGTDDQRDRFLPGILKCEDLWCEGFSEPNAGSDLAAVRTTATKVDGGYLVTGQKIWTSGAQHSDYCYLLVKTSSDAPRHRNLSLLLMNMHQKGVEVRPIRQITDESEFSEVFFDGAFVADRDLLGQENDGWDLGTLGGFRQGRGVFNGLRRYVMIRSAMDQCEMCATELGKPRNERLHRDVELLRRHTMRCTELLARGEDVRRPATLLKLIWSQLWQRTSLEGQSLGCEEHEEYWRRDYLYSRSVTIAGGSSQIQHNVIADRILQLPRS